MRGEPVAFGAADVTNCDREQIHIPGSVQPHGCLLALVPGDLRIVQAGGNTAALLGAAPQDLLGTRLSERIGPALTAAIQGVNGDVLPSRRVLTFDAGRTGDEVPLEALVHVSEDLIVLEIEQNVPDEDFPRDTLGLVQELVGDVQRTKSVSEFCQTVVERIRGVTGFDRVMFYRFLPDGSGSVDAEARDAKLEPYLGLRYPASDIPAQARALYLRNTLRLIPDARYVPAPLYAAADWPASKPLDLSQSVLRSVSPIHLEYLGNMGVAASMSISIVIDGRLWGLIACHHYTPRFLPLRLRTALDLFSQMASFQLETKLAAAELEIRLRNKAVHEDLFAGLAADPDISRGLQRLQNKLLEYIPSSGLALWIDGSFARIGETPSEEQVGDIVRWLNAHVTDGVFHTDRLSAHYPRAEGFARVASGMLSISVSRSPRDYVIWFRPELVQVVRWAGDPNKALNQVDGETRLSPRKSFADWKQQVRLQSESWNTADVKTAQSLRVSLLEVVLEHVDHLARERLRARMQQDALVAELDHRIAQWEQTAEQLKVESDRRAVLEIELSQVLRRTVVEQESERQRIARELHDSLGQYLTALQLDLDGIGRDESASASVKVRVERLKALTADAGQEVNNLAWEIRPTALDDLGLQTAFQQYLEEWGERCTLQFDLHLTLQNRRLEPPIETTLYRVLQEAIRNVVKHAEATRVGVILEATDKEVRLIVEDDGKGFALHDEQGGGEPSSRLGLLGVRERLALVGGSLEIETSPRQGTTLLIHVPL